MTNIAELLRNAPKGIKLYSPLFGDVRLVCVNCDNNILVETEMHDNHYFAYNGAFRMFGCYPHSECLLFPGKECRTWEEYKINTCKFKVLDWIVRNNGSSDIPIQVYGIKKDRYLVINMLGTKGEVMITDQDKWRLWTIADAKDGDVLMTTKIRNCPFIYRKTDYNNDLAYYYAGVDGNGDFCEGCLKRTLYHFGPVENVVPATKEQRDLLFQKMKEAGYQWDANKKELRKIKPHYDISKFNPFDKVLVRQDDSCTWGVSFFGRYSGMFICCSNVCFTQCIPFDDDTKHLLGTTDMPSEEYINW